MKREILPDYASPLDIGAIDLSQMEPEKQTSPWLRPLLEAAPSLIALVLYLLGIANQHPLLSKLLLIAVIATVAVLPIRYALKLTKWIIHNRVARQFTARENEQLLKRLKQFGRFTSSSDSRGILSILRSASSESADVGHLLNSYYLETWIGCFRQQMTFPPRSLDEFLQRVCEFQALVSTFDRSFVLAIQRMLTTLSSPIQSHLITQLEAFREDFNRYLGDVEEWGESLAAAVQKMRGNVGLDYSRLPVASFDRVPTFTPPGTTVLVNGKRV